jgi:tetratricopeptide (TPR) repeat protein
MRSDSVGIPHSLLNRRFFLFILFFITIVLSLVIFHRSVRSNFANLRFRKTALQIYQEKKDSPWSLLFQQKTWDLIAIDSTPIDTLNSSSFQNITNSDYLPSNYLSGLTNLLKGNFDIAIVTFHGDLASGIGRAGLTSFFLGTAYGLDGFKEKAIQSWRQDPEILAFFLREGKFAFYNQQDPGLALKFFTIADELAPTNCEALYRLGITLIDLNRNNEALKVLDKVDRRTCPKEFLGEIYYLLGKIYSQVGNLNLGIEYARQSLNLNSNDIKRLSLLGTLLTQRGDKTSEATALFNKVVQMDPGNVWSYVNPCNIYRLQKEFSRAVQWCHKAVEDFPENVFGFYYMGQVYLDWGNFTEAIPWFAKAIELDANNVSAWNRLGDAYRMAGEIPKALDSYRTSMKISPGDPYAQQTIEELLKSDSSGEGQK